MQILVTREACCAQDDQLGPLDATYALEPGATLRELVEQIIRSGFLQYSSSHTSMLGKAGSVEIVKVYSSYYLPGRAPEYLVAASEPAARLLEGKVLRFRFFFE
jgi:hypothetical protein